MSGYHDNDRKADNPWQGHRRVIRRNRRAKQTANTANQEIDAADFETAGKRNKKISYASATIGSRGREHSKVLNPTELMDNFSPEWLL